MNRLTIVCGMKWNWPASFTMWSTIRLAPVWYRIQPIGLGRVRGWQAKAPAPRLRQTLAKCRNSMARTSAQCHLVSLPSPDGKTIAAAPHLARIRTAFGALGEPASAHQVDDGFQLLLFLFGPMGGQNLGISVEHDVAGIGEAQLSSIDFGALRRQEHDRTYQVVGHHGRH